MAALCKAPTKSAGIGLSITAVCKNAGKKTLGQDDFFVVVVIICIRISFIYVCVLFKSWIYIRSFFKKRFILDLKVKINS